MVNIFRPPVPVPFGAIAIWTGTLAASIPPNWSLCDGTGGTPNLIARFLRGAPAATNPGTIGGADSHAHASMTATGGHTHTAQTNSHSHTVNSSGGHTHSWDDNRAAAWNPGVYVMGFDSIGAHQHTTVSGDHTHTMNTPANHTHTISTDDGRPLYYEVAYIQAGVGAEVAANIIIIWTGTLVGIPAGWSLCDGGGGRPDLRTRFVRGVNTGATNPGTTGGASTHGHTETAGDLHTHTMNNSGNNHTFSAYTWTHDHNTVYINLSGEYALRQTDSGDGNHTHATTNTDSHNHNAMGNDGSHSHTVNAASSLPAYYDVAYIINDGGAVVLPQNGVLIWTGLLVNIPAGYNLCDGGGGRPELRGRFLRGASAGVDPGGTGGADTHTHTDQNAGAHNSHTMVNTGAHTHTDTDSIGEHIHAKVRVGEWQSEATQIHNNISILYNNGVHSHTFNSENNHTHTLTDPGNHNHNNWSTDDGRPAYYEVAFIIKS